jgi:lipopolysaccharide/colanic/teichoic acid biosynthesis glycosyltransferase
MNAAFARRAVDIAAAALGLAVLAPLFGLIAAAIWAADGPPIFFRQQRLGRNWRPFPLYKFRSMRRAAAGKTGPQVTAAGDPRITPLGRWLRRSKLDELPQLWNVLRGDMSLIGPRPEVARYARAFRREYDALLAVRPGLIDPATLRFASEEEMLPLGPERERCYLAEILPRKIALSRAYLAHRTWRSDLRLLAAAFAPHGRRRNAHDERHAQPAR